MAFVQGYVTRKVKSVSYHTDEHGVPHINGKPAKYDPDVLEIMADVLAPWRCPECNAQLSTSGICLNTCHLSQGERTLFQGMMRMSQARSDRK